MTAWGLNVRAAPGVDQPVSAHLSRGDVAPVLAVDEATGWLKVQLANGKTGWIMGSKRWVVNRQFHPYAVQAEWRVKRWSK